MKLAMKRSRKRIVVILSVAVTFAGAYPASAGNPIGDFFKRLGNSIARPQGTPVPKRSTRKKSSSTTKNQGDKQQDSPEATPPDSLSPTPAPTVTPGPKASLSRHPTPTPIPRRTPMPVPTVVRSAVGVPPSKKPLPDLPYGIPIPIRPGFVTSPYAPKSGYVDVRSFPSGTEVKDPYTGKNFLVP